MKISPHKTIGIIGGRGKTGSQFANLFRKKRFRVFVTGHGTSRKNSEIIRSCDIIIFALPLSRAAEIMRRELTRATRIDQLILDVSSLKAREVEAMLTGKGEVIGMHPLFGPSTDPQGELVVLCPGRATKETIRSLQMLLLRRMGIQSVLMTPEEHDRLMGTLQVLPHLKSLLMADVMRTLKIDLRKALKVCTPIYELEFSIIGRFLDDHPDLYMPIIFRNPETRKIVRALQKSLGAFAKIAEKEDLPGAERRYSASQKFFASHLKRSRAKSEACVRTLASLTK